MKFTENRGVVVVLGLITLIASIMLIGMLLSGQNFDNHRLDGSYLGNINVPNQPTMAFDIIFDGKSTCAGTISWDDDVFSFSEEEYVTIGTSVQFSMYSVEKEQRFAFIGELTEDNLVVLGEMQYFENFESIPNNGTFYLSKV